MTVGFFSPLPPARTGVADYSAALLSGLQQFGEVIIGEDGDVNLYHIGNNQLHAEIYRHALRRPGVVVLHDAVLQHFLLGSLTEDEYIAEFVFNYGGDSRELARDLWKNRARSAVDPRYFSFPMLKRVVASAKSIIVHNPAAARIAAEHLPGARIEEIPHLFEPPDPIDQLAVARLRERHGISADTFVAGIFGHLRESKRLQSVVRACRGQKVTLLLAGEFASSDLERAMAPLLDQPGIIRVGHTPEHDFWLYASMVDCCVNLRYPAAGETSGIAIRLMGIGKPVIVTNGEEVSRFPESACLRVDSGSAETEMLSEFMVLLQNEPNFAAEVGRRAAAHIARNHSLPLVCQRYHDVVFHSQA